MIDRNDFSVLAQKMIQQNFQVSFFLTFILLSSGFLQFETPKPDPQPFGDTSPISDSTEQEYKKFQYSVVDRDPAEVLNCSNYVTENEYILLENGSLVLPGSEAVHDYNTYFLQNGSAFLCPEEKGAATVAERSYNFSKEFLSCGHLLLERHEYKLLENGDVYVEMYSKTYDPSDYYQQEHGVYICIPDFEEIKQNRSGNGTFFDGIEKFTGGFTYVTYVGLLVSIVSLMSHLIVFCLVSSVRNLPGYCLASLSLSLLLAYICYLTATHTFMAGNCANLGMCVYYFFLTSFFWMNAIAFDVWRSFRVVMRELRISSHRVPWRRFLLYSAYSWTIPAALTVFVKVCDSTDIVSDEYKPSFGAAFCWFGNRKALLVFFALPLIVVMILNAVFFLDVACVISRATLKASQSHEATLKKRFFMFMRLALIMGLTWIVGLIAGYADNIVMWYIFIVLNTLQGLFIFVVFSCSSKVRGLFCKKYRKHSENRGSTSVRTISQISATF